MFDEQTTREAAAPPAPAPPRRSPAAPHDSVDPPTDGGSPTPPSPDGGAEAPTDGPAPATTTPSSAAMPQGDPTPPAEERWVPPPAAAAGAPPAPVGARVGAYILDCLLVNITLVITAAAAGLVPVSADGMPSGRAYVAGIISAVVTLAYFAASEALAGRTLGKRLLRCAVVTTDGARPSWVAATVRRAPFVAGLLVPTVGPLLLFAVPLAALVTAIQDGPVSRGFHDRLAGTRVVHR